ncbi:DUF805 domain-containing protein [Roseateles cellulosilyticus]|uniref:DUF805 domain-containing protein n=1 Tax=Pelomonas cellulosilytica TaxID=2906762 RepID=A0ABS8XSR9_9BURK|nr:DUF805 domain-containing protein [Pelomonas sp. P8]MCE4555752.1 DUF805 domain-containing protein [Pelomonas sp. P8]
MTFQESIQVCFQKYADFSGRASRSEYWWFFLFIFAGCIVLSIVSHWLSVIFALGTLVPQFAAASRRLHDTGRSGWWQLITLVPLIGWIILIVLLAQEGTDEATVSA